MIDEETIKKIGKKYNIEIRLLKYKCRSCGEEKTEKYMIYRCVGCGSGICKNCFDKMTKKI